MALWSMAERWKVKVSSELLFGGAQDLAQEQVM